MASGEQSSWRETWDDVDGTSRPARTSRAPATGGRVVESVRLRAVARSHTLGALPRAPCPLSLPPDPLPRHGRGTDLKMSWGCGGTWDGWGPRRGWLRGRHVGPSPPGPRPPSHSPDGHSANPASPRAVQGSLPEARPGACGDTKCAFSKLRTCGPANPSPSGWPALYETPQAHSILGRRAGTRWPQP